MPADTLIVIAKIQQATCEIFGVDHEALLSHRKTRTLAHARILGMALARELTTASSSAVGRAFHRDHTTVLHAVRRARVLLYRHPEYRAKRAQIIDAVCRP